MPATNSNKLGADTVSTIEQLFSSMNGLGAAIKSAREKLIQRSGVAQSIMERLNSYDSILVKQRDLAGDAYQWIISLCERRCTGGPWRIEVKNHRIDRGY